MIVAVGPSKSQRYKMCGLGEGGEGVGDAGVSLDEPPVETRETKECTNISDRSGDGEVRERLR